MIVAQQHSLTPTPSAAMLSPAGNKSARDWRPGISKRIGRASGFFYAQRSALHYVGLGEAAAMLAGSLDSCTPTSFSPGSMIGVMLSGNPRNLRITDMNTKSQGETRQPTPSLELSYTLSKQIPSMAHGFVIQTNYGYITVDGGDSKAFVDAITKVIKRKLADGGAQ